MPIARSAIGYGRPLWVKPQTPGYVLAVNPGEWGTIPSSQANLSPVWGGDIFSSWCGGIVNTTGLYDGSDASSGANFISGTFLVYQSGGHTIDFDEIYAFGPLESNDSSIRKWRRIRDRTSPSIVNTDENGAGTPVSGHSYASLTYDPINNTMIRMGIAFRYSDANPNLHIYRYRFNISGPNTNQPWIKNTPTLNNPAYTAVLDNVQRRVWFRSSGLNEVGYYNLDLDTVSVGFGKTPNPGDDTGATAYDTTRGLWMTIGNGYALYQTNNGTSNDYWTPNIASGSPPTMGAGTYGAVLYEPVADRFVVWMSGGKTLHFLKAPATNPYFGGNSWTWSSTTPAGGATPTAPNANGTFGRWARVAFYTGEVIYVAMNSPAANIDFYRAA